ncbi:methyltransferase [Amphritea pacifica]|uniref:Methyltransferase n=1 Tax=Amphritea pacifica TaxID=2811233 RepID=A0ABS2W8Z8_9GAMM|nr:methyltransferase [Amphritea pacifica]MBN0988048.1 methyltransferase [Amphritea pacifica]MBN1006693.1 methyltransferase [Amphritea pacifica]
MTTSPTYWHSRLQQLDQQLVATAHLWRPQPFKLHRPEWCNHYPELTEALLALDERQLACLNHDSEALQDWIGHYLPQIASLRQLCRLPERSSAEYCPPENRFFDGMPGRKRTQIEAFARGIGPVQSPLLEWCGGKGHLGRLLGRSWQQPVTTLEWNAELCRMGEQQARRLNIPQQFRVIDLLQPDLQLKAAGHHAIALHACGELHRTLERVAIDQHLDALDLVPCCYAFGVEHRYRPRTAGLSLQLSRDDLRLAVTETVTAGQREVLSRDREMAWKLGYIELRNRVQGSDQYRPMKPVSKPWLQLSYSEFCHKLAEREQFQLPVETQWAAAEALGWRRYDAVMRLSLLRNCFRRAIELWLVLDLACDLESHGYHVELGTFCDRSVTPRNIMLSARKRESRSEIRNTD